MSSGQRVLALGALAALVLLAACGGASPTAPTSAGAASIAAASPQTPALTPERERLLRDLVARANQEGALDAEISDTAMPVAGVIRDAFLNRFAPLGLNIQVNLGAGQQPTVWANAQATLLAGGVPQYDAMLGLDDTHIYPFVQQGLLQRIDNWQELLAAVDPAVADGTVKPDERSPEPFTGYAIVFDDLLRIVLFNPEMITKDQLPKTYLDLADPRYKGQFAVPPWSGVYLIPVLFYDRDRWLDVAAAIGQNAAGVATFPAGAQQVLARQIAFQTDNLGSYFAQRSLGPNVPVDFAWYDYTALLSNYYAIPVRARHPAAATLFSLYMATDEGRATWAPNYVALNIRNGRLPVDEQIRQSLTESKTTLAGWFSSPEGQKVADWVHTPEGEAYVDRLLKVITRRS